MSTTQIPNPAQGAAVTGQEDDFLNFVRQTVAEQVAQAQAPGTVQQNPPAQTPISVNLNGQTFQFSTQEDLNRALQNTFSQYNTELAKLREAQSAPTPRGGEVTGSDDAPAFDINTFVNKMTTNPVEAFDYVDEIRYGVKNPAEAVKAAIASKGKVDEINQALSVYRFRDAHPEFNPQAAPVMQEIMKAANLTPDFAGLEAAYALGVMKGVIQPLQLQAPQQGQFPQQAPGPQFQTPNPAGPPMFSQNPYGSQGAQFNDPRMFNGGFNNGIPMAPPRPGRSEPVALNDFGAMAESMTPEQIEAVFSKFSS